ncbi:MAG: glycosyltransferase [Rhodospirillaceae bacterium]|nr:glycosyltransferase [Rhodospirillaceae bacterium]
MNMNVSLSRQPAIAVLVPCYNEEAAIAAVVRDFKAVLPTATVYVYDNNSKDRTREVAARAGAVVRSETLQGKGNVVRRMFADIEADIYVMVDGDATYDAASAPKLIRHLIDQKLDMVNGARVSTAQAAYRRGHRFGNVMLTGLVTAVFGKRTADMLSGFRVFSRRFVKSFPALAGGFEIETELTVHALELRMPMGEIATPYKERPPGSMSKLSTFKDGFRILRLIGKLVREERPLEFFSITAGVVALTSLILGAPVVGTYLETGLVPRLPTAVLAMGLMIVAVLTFACGVILDTVTRGRREMKRLRYLELPAPDFPDVQFVDVTCAIPPNSSSASVRSASAA